MESQGKDPISDKSWKELDEGMWGILMDKLEGEARGILLSVPDGEGLSAWAKLWRVVHKDERIRNAGKA